MYSAAHISGVESIPVRAFTFEPWSIAACTLCGVPVFTSSKKFVVCAYADAAKRTARSTATAIPLLTFILLFPPSHYTMGPKAPERNARGKTAQNFARGGPVANVWADCRIPFSWQNGRPSGAPSRRKPQNAQGDRGSGGLQKGLPEG